MFYINGQGEMFKMTGNVDIDIADRKYYVITWLDTGDKELSWGYNKYPKPEGTYVDMESYREYTIEYYKAG